MASHTGCADDAPVHPAAAVLLVLFLLFVGFASHVAAATAGGDRGAAAEHRFDPFPTPRGLRNAVDFWTQVFAVWRRGQVALHDDEHLGLVYEVVDVPGVAGESLDANQRAHVQERRHALQRTLGTLEDSFRRGAPLSSEQQALLGRIGSVAGRAALRGASARVHSQRGMRERFLSGLETSGRYDGLIREALKGAGLPEDLAYLPHVESSFLNHVRSSAGAVGVWQFMPSAGRSYLRMHPAVDERYDPVFAARGAARYLADAYARLGDWPLAVTSYNHGVGGMLRAKAQFGNDIERIVRNYRGRVFGFSSRNFYAEFLAVRAIMGQLPHYFPEGVRFQKPLDHHLLRLTRPVPVGHLTRMCRANRETLAGMNPAWTAAAVNGRVPLPRGTDVWLPKGVPGRTPESRSFLETVALTDGVRPMGAAWHSMAEADPSAMPTVYRGLPRGSGGNKQAASRKHRMTRAGMKARAPRSGAKYHIVRRGESIHLIAARYKVKPSRLLTVNDMKRHAVIRPGQRLRIPMKS